jgi:hypothetical protein
MGNSKTLFCWRTRQPYIIAFNKFSVSAIIKPQLAAGAAGYRPLPAPLARVLFRTMSVSIGFRLSDRRFIFLKFVDDCGRMDLQAGDQVRREQQ